MNYIKMNKQPFRLAYLQYRLGTDGYSLSFDHRVETYAIGHSGCSEHSGADSQTKSTPGIYPVDKRVGHERVNVRGAC